jgi:hypothetical protein
MNFLNTGQSLYRKWLNNVTYVLYLYVLAHRVLSQVFYEGISVVLMQINPVL